MSFGKNVLKARTDKRLSLQDLSDRSGVSRSMLSKIEREEKNPTIEVACKVAEALEMTLSQLLEEQTSREVTVIRKAERLVFKDEASGFERHLLSPSMPSRGIEFILNVVPPGGMSGQFPAHKSGVKEYIAVAKGQLEVTLSGETYILKAGDSLYYEANAEHSFANKTQEECQYYLVIDSHNMML